MLVLERHDVLFLLVSCCINIPHPVTLGKVVRKRDKLKNFWKISAMLACIWPRFLHLPGGSSLSLASRYCTTAPLFSNIGQQAEGWEELVGLGWPDIIPVKGPNLVLLGIWNMWRLKWWWYLLWGGICEVWYSTCVCMCIWAVCNWT